MAKVCGVRQAFQVAATTVGFRQCFDVQDNDEFSFPLCLDSDPKTRINDVAELAAAVGQSADDWNAAGNCFEPDTVTGDAPVLNVCLKKPCDVPDTIRVKKGSTVSGGGWSNANAANYNNVIINFGTGPAHFDFANSTGDHGLTLQEFCDANPCVNVLWRDRWDIWGQSAAIVNPNLWACPTVAMGAGTDDAVRPFGPATPGVSVGDPILPTHTVVDLLTIAGIPERADYADNGCDALPNPYVMLVNAPSTVGTWVVQYYQMDVTSADYRAWKIQRWIDLLTSTQGSCIAGMFVDLPHLQNHCIGWEENDHLEFEPANGGTETGPWTIDHGTINAYDNMDTGLYDYVDAHFKLMAEARAAFDAAGLTDKCLWYNSFGLTVDSYRNKTYRDCVRAGYIAANGGTAADADAWWQAGIEFVSGPGGPADGIATYGDNLTQAPNDNPPGDFGNLNGNPSTDFLDGIRNSLCDGGAIVTIFDAASEN